MVYVRRFQFVPFMLKNGHYKYVLWKIWTIHSFESERKILQENTYFVLWRKNILSYNFAINDSKHYQTKFWESIRLWISSRMWGWYTLDVSSLPPSFWKMVPLILFNKIFQILTYESAGNTWNIFTYYIFWNFSITKWKFGCILALMYDIIYKTWALSDQFTAPIYHKSQYFVIFPLYFLTKMKILIFWKLWKNYNRQVWYFLTAAETPEWSEIVEFNKKGTNRGPRASPKDLEECKEGPWEARMFNGSWMIW